MKAGEISSTWRGDLRNFGRVIFLPLSEAISAKMYATRRETKSAAYHMRRGVLTIALTANGRRLMAESRRRKKLWYGCFDGVDMRQ